MSEMAVSRNVTGDGGIGAALTALTIGLPIVAVAGTVVGGAWAIKTIINADAEAQADFEQKRQQRLENARQQVESELRARDELARRQAASSLDKMMSESDAARRAALDGYIKSTALKRQTIKTPSPQKTSKEKNFEMDSNALIEECHRLYRRLQHLNPDSAAAHNHLMAEIETSTESTKPDPKRLSLIMDELKLSYGRELTTAVRTRCHQEELAEMLAAADALGCPASFITRIKTTVAAQVITEEEALPLWQDFFELANQIAEKNRRRAISEAAQAAQKFLAELGYEVLDSQSGPLELDQAGYLSTPNPDYLIECRMDSRGGLAFKQVKVAVSETEAIAPLSDYQRQVDLENGRAWCRAHEEMLSKLKAAGYVIDVKFLQEPGKSSLPILINPNKVAAKKAALRPKNEGNAQ